MSSDSSDNENLDLLKEAVDYNFLNDHLLKNESCNSFKEETELPKEQPLPSLRRRQDENDQFNSLKVTPEVQNYIAKHLSKILEQNLQKKLCRVTTNNNHLKKRRKCSIKLFRNSERFLKVSKCPRTQCVNNLNQEESNTLKQYSVKRQLNANLENISETDLKAVAVEPLDILSQKDTKAWSNRSKAPVYHYRKSSGGGLVLVEPKFE